jgi:hypothetical protein
MKSMIQIPSGSKKNSSKFENSLVTAKSKEK